MAFERITIDSRQIDGMPCIRNLRIPVAAVVDMLAAGMTLNESLEDYPDLEIEDIQAALREHQAQWL